MSDLASRIDEILDRYYGYAETYPKQTRAAKTALKDLIAKEVLAARIDENRIAWDWPRDKGLQYFEERLQKREQKLINQFHDVSLQHLKDTKGGKSWTPHSKITVSY